MGGRGSAGRKQSATGSATVPEGSRQADEQEERTVATPPGPESTPTEQARSAAPVTGEMSLEPLLDNDWGLSKPDAVVSFHNDGEIGSAIKRMGPDAHMDVDGEPLANVLGKVATDVVYGRRTAQDALDEYKAIRDRLPEGSQAHKAMFFAVLHMDAPATPPPALPQGAPQPLRQLAADLHAVPMVRADPGKELATVQRIAEQLAAGRMSIGRAEDEIRRSISNQRHESMGDTGKYEIDRAADRGIAALRDLANQQAKEDRP
jgi:hypothetical protein